MSQADPRLELAQASRILYAKGVVDAFGHVSRRHSEDADLFLMSRSMAPGLVQVTDILDHDLDGHPVSEPEARVFLERFIHAEIYRRRPDVMAIVHSHAPEVIPFTVVKSRPLRPICHMCGFLDALPSTFDIANFAGPDSNLLIGNADLGRAFSDHLGDANLALMRGHGFTAVGTTLAQAVFRSVYTGLNSRLQMSALQLGDPQYLTPGEAVACDHATNSQVDRAWSLWLCELDNLPGLST